MIFMPQTKKEHMPGTDNNYLLTLISDNIHYNVLDEINNTFPSVNGAAALI